jgi:hypothetical protein
LEGLSQITVLSLISLNVPGVANQVNSVLLQLAQLDVLPTPLIEEAFLTFNDFEDTPINDNFDQFGLSGTNSLRNMGSAFIYVFIGALALPSLYILNALISFFAVKSQKLERARDLVAKWSNGMQWNFFIRLLLS